MELQKRPMMKFSTQTKMEVESKSIQKYKKKQKSKENMDTRVYQEITCDMCSAAATLGFTTSQFAMTSVFGTLPSVWKMKEKRVNTTIQHYFQII